MHTVCMCCLLRNVRRNIIVTWKYHYSFCSLLFCQKKLRLRRFTNDTTATTTTTTTMITVIDTST